MGLAAHVDRASAEEAGELATATGDLTTTATRGDSLKSIVAGRMLQHAVYAVRPGWYLVHRLMRLANLPLTGEEIRGRGDEWNKLPKVAEAERLELTPEFMVDVGGRRWFVNQGKGRQGNG